MSCVFNFTVITRNHVLIYEEYTVLCQVEVVLNSWPLTPASSDPHDLECMTPDNFLIGQPLLAVPSRLPAESKRSVVNRLFNF